MNRTKTRKPAEQWQTLLMAIGGFGLGLWCLFSHEWKDNARYYVSSRSRESGEIRDGKDMNRGRQIVGALSLLVGFYSAYCLVRRKSPFFADCDFEPELIYEVIPEMPAALNARSIGGRATIEFVISTMGEVIDAKVYLATHPEFGEAALKAIRQWKFNPAMKGDVPKACLVRQSIDFTPEGLRNLSQRSFRTGNS